jgi:hypothetical protein
MKRKKRRRRKHELKAIHPITQINPSNKLKSLALLSFSSMFWSIQTSTSSNPSLKVLLMISDILTPLQKGKANKNLSSFFLYPFLPPWKFWPSATE